MNKDTIYIEPADDITDIIAKIKDSQQKVVALVPPKKLGVLASAINIKLIAKAAKSTSKAVVLVTDNPSLMKLCAAAELPVAETLQSRPAVPTDADIDAAEGSSAKLTIAEEAEEAEAREAKEELAKEFTAELDSAADLFDQNTESVKVNNPELDSAEIEDELAADAAKGISGPSTIEIDEAEDEKSTKSSPRSDKSDKSAKSTDDSDAESPEEKSAKIKKIRKWGIIGTLVVLTLTGALIWAFAIAPAVDIIVSVGTISGNFSENVSFTTKQSEEDPDSGKFYLETLEYKETLSSPLTATEEKNLGEKASGELTLSFTFSTSGAQKITVPKGSVFTQTDKKYLTTKDLTLAIPGDCTVSGKNCAASASVAISAAEAGEEYNIASKNVSWKSNISGIAATNNEPITGGSNKIVKVVQQKDIDAAVATLKKLNDSEAKEILTEKLSDGYILIDSSYKATASEPKSSVKLGEEAGEGAKVDQEISYNIYAVDSESVTKYIRKKANLGSDQKIYELGDPYIERFTMTDDGITGKLKTSYKAGPEITSDIAMEKVKGKKIGEAYSMLQSINGVRSVKINPSFFWVNSVPSDANKIHIQIEVEK